MGLIRILFAAVALASVSAAAHAHDRHDPPPPAPAEPAWRDRWNHGNNVLGFGFGVGAGFVADQALKNTLAPLPRRSLIMGGCIVGAHALELEDKREPGNGYSTKGVILASLGCAIGVYGSERFIVWNKANGTTMVGLNFNY